MELTKCLHLKYLIQLNHFKLKLAIAFAMCQAHPSFDYCDFHYTLFCSLKNCKFQLELVGLSLDINGRPNLDTFVGLYDAYEWYI